jgi:hypothetical protein
MLEKNSEKMDKVSQDLMRGFESQLRELQTSMTNAMTKETDEDKRKEERFRKKE